MYCQYALALPENTVACSGGGSSQATAASVRAGSLRNLRRSVPSSSVAPHAAKFQPSGPSGGTLLSLGFCRKRTLWKRGLFLHQAKGGRVLPRRQLPFAARRVRWEGQTVTRVHESDNPNANHGGTRRIMPAPGRPDGPTASTCAVCRFWLPPDSSDFLLMTQRSRQYAVSDTCHVEHTVFLLFRGSSCLRLQFAALSSSVSNLFCLNQPEHRLGCLEICRGFPSHPKQLIYSRPTYNYILGASFRIPSHLLIACLSIIP
jgi:hypothetical protein